MSLLIDITIALFSGWLTNYFLGKSNHGIFGYLAIGIIGSIIGFLFIESFISSFTPLLITKLISTLSGSLLFQIGLNLLRREKKERENTKKQTKLT